VSFISHHSHACRLLVVVNLKGSVYSSLRSDHVVGASNQPDVKKTLSFPRWRLAPFWQPFVFVHVQHPHLLG
jgi:hypothetical protein